MSDSSFRSRDGDVPVKNEPLTKRGERDDERTNNRKGGEALPCTGHGCAPAHRLKGTQDSNSLRLIKG